MKFSINHHHHRRRPYKTHHDSTQTTCLPQAALRIWLAHIDSGKGMKEPDHSIVSFPSKYCSCPWLRFPACFWCRVMRDAVHRNVSSEQGARWGSLPRLTAPGGAGEGCGPGPGCLLAAGWGTGWICGARGKWSGLQQQLVEKQDCSPMERSREVRLEWHA